MPKTLILFILLLSTSKIYANPSPLGIELNKSNLDDVKKTYRILRSTQNATQGYYNNFLDTQNIPMDTLSEVDVISNDNKIVEGVLLELNKNQFDEIYKMLSDKYKVLSSQLPFVGNKYVKLQDGDCYITIEAPHMSFKMSVAYITKNLENKYHNRLDTEQTTKQEKTKGML